MSVRTRKILVNFFQITPTPATEPSYDRLRAAFNILNVNDLNDRGHRLDFILDCEYVKRENGLLTGAINNGQTGGVMPLRRQGKGLYNEAISPGERLGHPSCFVYDINRSLLLLESLPNGASPNDWSYYFKSHLHDSPAMVATVIERQTSENLLADLKYITRFDINVAGYRRNDLFSQHSSSRELGELSDMAEAAKAATVNCSLSTEVRRLNKKKQRPDQDSLDKSYIRRILDKIRGEPEVQTLAVSGLYEEDSPRVEVINLLEFRLKDEVEVPITELSAVNLNLAKRIARLTELLTTHQELLSRYSRPHAT